MTNKKNENKIKQPDKTLEKKGRWAKVANRFRSEGNLKGKSEEVNKIIKEFRTNFQSGYADKVIRLLNSLPADKNPEESNKMIDTILESRVDKEILPLTAGVKKEKTDEESVGYNFYTKYKRIIDTYALEWNEEDWENQKKAFQEYKKMTRKQKCACTMKVFGIFVSMYGLNIHKEEWGFTAGKKTFSDKDLNILGKIALDQHKINVESMKNPPELKGKKIMSDENVRDALKRYGLEGV